MKFKSTDLVSLFEAALNGTEQPQLEEIGVVVQVGDGICKVYGLHNAVLGEMVKFDGGNTGIVFQLDEDAVEIFIFHTSLPVAEREIVSRTGRVFHTPVGAALVGRVLNATGVPIDGMGDVDAEAYVSIENVIPGIVDRSPVNRPLETGILVVDALVPIGKGQRELIIGNRNTGKTSMAIDTILNQKNKDVICIYVSIGQRQANVARIVHTLEENDALKYTIVVSAEAGEAVLNQYVAPYVGCAIGEYFMAQGKDVLIVYDDLSNHAIAFREMSLLLRRAPGREAYPGDIFYLHSRLLERAGKLKTGGSLTALPIVQIQSDDITAYIPTNLISITDGQIFLDTKLFNQGIRPAVNVELSVSRVAGAAQIDAMKKMTKALRLELAQYQELIDFTQFGTELDDVSKKRLTRGALAIELLKQPARHFYSLVDEVLILFLLKESFIDKISMQYIQIFITQFVSYVAAVYPDVYEMIGKTEVITEATRFKLIAISQEFSMLFVPPAQ